MELVIGIFWRIVKTGNADDDIDFNNTFLFLEIEIIEIFRQIVFYWQFLFAFATGVRTAQYLGLNKVSLWSLMLGQHKWKHDQY